MKIESVKLALPSRSMSNDAVVSLIHQHSKETYRGDIKQALDRIEFLLAYSGAENRYWLDERETPLELMTHAVEAALAEAGCLKSDIDLMIYASVDRGFVEPANAYFVAQALGMNRVHCFDILDACNGWSRALHLVNAWFKTGIYQRALVINSECNMFAGGTIYPALFQLRSYEDVEHFFAGYTIGEGVTATILAPDESREWDFRFSSRNDLASLCSAPVTGYERYSVPSEQTGRNGILRFTSYGREMFTEGMGEVYALYQSLNVPVSEIKAIFPHAAAKKVWQDAAEMAGIDHLMYFIYPQHGNLVSASVPAGVALALEEGRIGRGDRLVGLVGSAGMSFSAYSFIY